jgi:5'-methylthioadenosine phosphorylase
MNEAVLIGVIGGSGLYHMAELQDVERHTIDTPFGAPSGAVVVGTLRGKRVAFLPRHGEGHVYPPARIPQRANIYALKSLGVRFIIGVNACGSLREDYAPGHIVIPDQLFDYNIGRRDRSFFEDDLVAHVSVADPYDAALRAVLVQAARDIGATAHDGGTFIIEDGPRFSTRAESRIFKAWGCDIIGMTTAPEAFLAREAEMAYATMAHITDYDAWRDHEEGVTVDMVIQTFRENVQRAEQALARAVELLDPTVTTPSHTALEGAIMTARDKLSVATVERLRPIVARALRL